MATISRVQDRFHSRSSLSHPPLDRTKNQIRILELKPGKPKDRIVAKFRVYNRANAPPYEALSYPWGSNALVHKIIVNDQTCLVSKNLYIALQHIRSRTKARLLWIDAICIDQRDLSERFHQVSMMADIYKSAALVLVWLGEAADDSDQVMDLIREISMAESDSQIKLRQELVEPVRLLLKRQYFWRVWVIQEIAMATADPLVGCGNRWLPFSELTRGFEAMNEQFLVHWRNSRLPAESEFYLDFLLYVQRVLNTGKLRQIAQDIFTAQPEQPMHRKSAAIEVLWRTRVLKCSDRRDSVYSLLGLLAMGSDSDKRSVELDPDYSRETRSVFIMTAKMVIRQERNYQILHMRNHLPSAFLPSWTPDMTPSRAVIYPVLSPMPWKEIYKCGGLNYQLALDEIPEMNDDDVLKVGGRCFDRLCQIIPMERLEGSPGILLKEIYRSTTSLRNARLSNAVNQPTSTDINDADLLMISKTLVAGTTGFEDSSPESYSQALGQMISNGAN